MRSNSDAMKLKEFTLGPYITPEELASKWAGVKVGDVIGFHFWCPGCEEPHPFYIKGPHAWTFDGNQESPTFAPSLIVHGNPVCHSFVRAGRIEFLGDCGHKLKGQTVDLPDYPPEWQ